MKLMVIIDGISRPYTSKNFPRRVRPLESLAKTKKTDSKPSIEKLETKEVFSKNVPNPYQKANINQSQRKQVFLAKDIMSFPPYLLNPNDTLNEAWSLMCQKRFRHLPVSSDGKHLTGILSDRDLLKNALDINGQKIVKHIMTNSVLTASPDSEIREISKILFEEKIGCMPIINQEELIIGIITRSDILRVVTNNAPFELWC